MSYKALVVQFIIRNVPHCTSSLRGPGVLNVHCEPTLCWRLAKT
jgi:hypothetical protein